MIESPAIRCYREYPSAPAVILGRSERDWKETVKQGWQRTYLQGRDAADRPTTAFHLSKRKLKARK